MAWHNNHHRFDYRTKQHPSDSGLFGYFIDVFKPGDQSTTGTSSVRVENICEDDLIIMPFPCRIDRIINGNFTSFPRVDQVPEITIDGKQHGLVMDKVHDRVRQNCLLRTRQHVTGTLKKIFNPLNGAEWWYYTMRSIPRIPTFQHDIQAMLQQYLQDVYARYVKNEDIIAGIQKYIEFVLELCRHRIATNMITIQYNNHEVRCRLYHSMRSVQDKLMVQPSSCLIDLVWKEIDPALGWEHYATDGVYPPKPDLERKECIPYVIYRDLQECFEYNKKLLESNDGRPYSPSILKNKGLITIMDA